MALTLSKTLTSFYRVESQNNVTKKENPFHYPFQGKHHIVLFIMRQESSIHCNLGLTAAKQAYYLPTII